MRAILSVALNDLRNTFAERAIYITLFVVPIAMTIFLGLVGGGTPTRIIVDVVADPSAGPLATQLTESLTKTEAGSATLWVLCDLNNQTSAPSACGLTSDAASTSGATQAQRRDLATERVRSGKAFSALIIPAAFSADIAASKPVTLDLIGKTGLNAPELVVNQVNGALTRLNGAVTAARVVTAVKNPTDRQAFYDKVFVAAEAIWASDPVRIDDQSSDGRVGAAPNNFSQSAPGMGAMFVMINALGLASIFIVERQNGVMHRLLLLPIPKWQLLAGKLLGRYVLGLIVFAVLLGVGSLFGAHWGDPLGTVAIVAVYVLAVTAMALAFSTVVRSQGQASGIALLVALTLAPLGGAWWPLDIAPEWMRIVGHISPIAWMQDAFAKLLYYSGTFVEILPMLGVLLIFAAVFFAFGIARFRYE